MRYLHWRDDFSVTEQFYSNEGGTRTATSVPQRVEIEYFTFKGHGRFVASRNGNTFKNCSLSADGKSLTVNLSLRDNPIGHGRLLRITSIITEDANFPGGLRYTRIPGKLDAVLYFGKSDGPLDMASEIVFDGVDRLSLLQDVSLSALTSGDLLSWNGHFWTNIPQSAVIPDLSGYARIENLSDYASLSDLSRLASSVTQLESEQFFEKVGDEINGFSVKLKDEYRGLWANGFVSSGGIGSSGESGGGGLIETVYGVSDLGTQYSGTEVLTATFSAKAIDTIYNALQTLSSNTYTKSEVNSLIAAVNSFSYEVVSTLPTAGLTTMYKIYLVPSSDPQAQNIKDEYITIYDGNAYSWEQIGSTAIDLSGYVQTTRKINGVDLSADRTFYTLGTSHSTTAARGTMLGVSAISYNLSSDAGSDSTRIEWDSTNGAWHVYGNIYADGWISAGGIGNGGSGSASALANLVDVQLTSLATNDLLTYNGTHWVNTSRSSIVPTISTTTTGDGNALTGVSYLNGELSFTKGSFLPLSGGTVTGTVRGSDGQDVYWQIDNDGSALFDGIQAGSIHSIEGESLIIGQNNDDYICLNDPSVVVGHYLAGAATFNDAFNDEYSWSITALGNATFNNTTIHGSLYGKDGNTTNWSITNAGAASLASLTTDGDILVGDTIHGPGDRWYIDDSGFSVFEQARYTSVLEVGTPGELVHLVYDSVNHALRVYGTYTENGETKDIGFYCDGWVSAGGVGVGGSGGYGVESITTNQDGTVDFHFTGGDITTVDLNHTHDGLLPTVTSSDNGKIPKVVNGVWALADVGGATVSISDNTTYGSKIAEITVDGTTHAIKNGVYFSSYDDTNKIVRLNVGTTAYDLCVEGYNGGGGGGTYTLPAASSSALGGIKLGYTQNAKNYPVELDSNNKAYVSVPWEGGSGGGGGGTVTSVAISVPTGLSVSGSPITTSGTISISLTDGYVIPQQSTLNGFVTITGAQTISGEKTFSSTIHGADCSLSGDLAFSATSSISLGSGTLTWDNVNSAWKLTGSLYVTGWLGVGGIGSGGYIDDELSSTSENAVQNKVIYAAIGDIETLINAL